MLEQIKSLGRGVANCYCEIKITSKLAQTHQSIENSQSMLSEQKEVSKKRSGKLLFWNKKTSKLAQSHQLRNSPAMLLKQNGSVERDSHIIIIFKIKIKTFTVAQSHQLIGNSQSMFLKQNKDHQEEEWQIIILE